MTAVPAPPRFRHRSLAEYAAILLVLALVVTSIVSTAPSLDKEGSILKPLLPLFKLGAGGKLGSGPPVIVCCYNEGVHRRKTYRI